MVMRKRSEKQKRVRAGRIIKGSGWRIVGVNRRKIKTEDALFLNCHRNGFVTKVDGMKTLPLAVTLAGALAALAGCATAPAPTPAPIEVAEMMGDWRIIAHVPHWSEKNCQASLVRFRQLPNQRIDTRFLAHKGGIYGRRYLVKGMTDVRDPKSGHPWDLHFVSGLYGFRVVFLHVADDGHYAVAMTPNRRRAWILSRKRTLSQTDFDAALRVLLTQGFDIQRLTPVPQIPWA